MSCSGPDVFCKSVMFRICTGGCGSFGAILHTKLNAQKPANIFLTLDFVFGAQKWPILNKTWINLFKNYNRDFDIFCLFVI